MNKIEKLAIGAIIAVAMTAFLFAAWGVWLIAFGGLQRSHINANTPVPSDFDRILRRDLQSFAETRRSGATLRSVEHLREGATQAGTGYPKFYAWAELASPEGLESGAVRLTAIKRQEFHVSDFVPCADARAHPSRTREIFPAPVAQAIDSRIERNGCPGQE